MKIFPLFSGDLPAFPSELPSIVHYPPCDKKSDAAIVIFPGGGYSHRSAHEGHGYAAFFAEAGITSFVVNYRVIPARFPAPLLDARRAMRFVRARVACRRQTKVVRSTATTPEISRRDSP
jgi:acetyl esterase/lipase